MTLRPSVKQELDGAEVVRYLYTHRGSFLEITNEAASRLLMSCDFGSIACAGGVQSIL
jgi:hypothetical protein